MRKPNKYDRIIKSTMAGAGVINSVLSGKVGDDETRQKLRDFLTDFVEKVDESDEDTMIVHAFANVALDDLEGMSPDSVSKLPPGMDY